MGFATWSGGVCCASSSGISVNTEVQLEASNIVRAAPAVEAPAPTTEEAPKAEIATEKVAERIEKSNEDTLKAVIETVKVLEEKLSHIKQSITVSIIGCIVNGPGEALNSDIGITGGGKGSNMLYLSGVTDQKISNDDIVNKVVKLVEERVAETNA